MSKELLMLYGARFAVLETMKQGGKAFEKDIGDNTYQRVEYADVCNYLTDMINKYKAISTEAESEE